MVTLIIIAHRLPGSVVPFYFPKLASTLSPGHQPNLSTSLIETNFLESLVNLYKNSVSGFIIIIIPSLLNVLHRV